MKTMLNDILEAKKGRTAGRFHNTDKKKPTTPDHKTKLKLKVGNQKENYMTVNPRAGKTTKLGMSVDVIHDSQKKKNTTERKDINLKTVSLAEADKEKAKELKEKKEKEKEELRKKKEKENVSLSSKVDSCLVCACFQSLMLFYIFF